MNKLKLNKDQIQKIALSFMGFVFLLYVYFSFFLGPLNRSHAATLKLMQDRQAKLSSSKTDLNRAATLERDAKNATSRYAALRALNPEGAPIAWFPPRIKVFFANEQIDKAGAKLESSSTLKQAELSSWSKYQWQIDLPQADYATLGKAIADLENAEPLLTVTKITIQALPDQPQFQQVDLRVANMIQKK
jgi:type II secretory pathway component PulM